MDSRTNSEGNGLARGKKTEGNFDSSAGLSQASGHSSVLKCIKIENIF